MRAGIIVGVIVGIVVLMLVVFVGMYNGLVRSRNRVREAWSGIDVQLRRRASLIPNPVETVKGYAAHERETFEEVTRARAALEQAGDPKSAGEANNMLTGALRHLFAVVVLPVAAYLAMYLMLWVALVLGMGLAGLGLVDVLSGDDGVLAFAVVDAVISVLILVLVVYLQFRFASALVLRTAGARRLTPGEEPELSRTVDNLCIGAGLPRPRLYLIESAAANAFATGLGPEHASPLVPPGLLDLLDRRELEGALAHELSQIGNHDI